MSGVNQLRLKKSTIGYAYLDVSGNRDVSMWHVVFTIPFDLNRPGALDPQHRAIGTLNPDGFSTLVKLQEVNFHFMTKWPHQIFSISIHEAVLSFDLCTKKRPWRIDLTPGAGNQLTVCRTATEIQAEEAQGVAPAHPERLWPWSLPRVVRIWQKPLPKFSCCCPNP